jgi:hypothetical protein
MSQQSVRQAARRSALDAKQCGAKDVPTGRASAALRAMTEDEGLSLREAAESCRSSVTVQESPGYTNSRTTRPAGATDERAT